MCSAGKDFHREKFSLGVILDVKKWRNFKKFQGIACLIFYPNSFGNLSHSLTNINHKLLFLSFLWLHAISTFSNFIQGNLIWKALRNALPWKKKLSRWIRDNEFLLKIGCYLIPEIIFPQQIWFFKIAKLIFLA